MKGRTSLHHALSALPVPSFKRTTSKSLSMLTSLTSLTSNILQSDLGEFLTFPHCPFSLIQCLQLRSPDRGLGGVLIYSSPIFPAKTPLSDYQTSPPFRCHFRPPQFRLSRPHNTTWHSGHTCWFRCTLVLFFSSLCVLSSPHFSCSHLMSLASPVSRMHTRNPFLRNSDDRIAPLTPLTPTAVPLPLPTPDELVDNNS